MDAVGLDVHFVTTGLGLLSPSLCGGHSDFVSKGMEAPEHDLFRMLNSEKSKVDFDHNGCCKGGAPCLNGMVADAMLLCPQGPTFPINICDMKLANKVGGNLFCVDQLQHNRYNMPFDHLT